MTITRRDRTFGITRWDPFRDLTSLRELMSRGFGDEALGRREEGFVAPSWLPAVDVYETPETLVLQADLPGLSREDVDIEVERNVLTIKGERKADSQVKEENYYRTERAFGSFYRSFTLPQAVASERIQATLRDGVLQVILPKAEEAKPRRVSVS